MGPCVVRVRDPGHWLLRAQCEQNFETQKLITAVSKVNIDKTREQCGPWAVCGLCVWYMVLSCLVLSCLVY